MTDPIETEAADLADAAERGELRPAGQPRDGEQARAEARALLMAATGTTTQEDAARVALGAPEWGRSDRRPATGGCVSPPPWTTPPAPRPSERA